MGKIERIMNWKRNINFILREFFYVLTGAIVIFSLLEIIWPGVVSAYINLNWILIFWLVAGIVVLTTFDN